MLSLINNLHEKKHRDSGFEICTRFQPFFMHSILNRMLCSTVFLVALSIKGNEAQASEGKYGKNILELVVNQQS